MLIKRTAILSLLFLMLFADNGQTVYAHTCFKLHKTTYSILMPTSCCGVKNTKLCCNKSKPSDARNCVLGKKSCCSIESKYVKQCFPNKENKLSEEYAAAEVITELGLFLAYNSTFAAKVPSSSSPPLLSKSDISLIRVFRI